ncbi:MAG: SDR family NAD(P)-dependent oxidoreductase [Rickettsiales bacterium]|nr:SDR family NAD(P)-dependent oxidoreductase [Rickettsiales bacterium]
MSGVAVIFGATSSLAIPLCRQLAKEGWKLALVARDNVELQMLADDVNVRFGAEVHTFGMDLASPALDAVSLWDRIVKKSGVPTLAVMLAGMMGNMETQEDPENIEQVMTVNVINPSRLISEACKRMAKTEAGGTVVVVSSVAGDRGRQSNFVYGSSKAALTAYASGLRNQYARTNVHVMTAKPGFIDTPLTYGMESPLIAARDTAAARILQAARRHCNTVYVPWFWRGIMLVIRHIPEVIFKRLSL